MDDFERMIYRNGFGLSVFLGRIWLFGMLAVATVLMFEQLVLLGNYWFGSNSLEAFVSPYIDAFMDKAQVPAILSVATLLAVLFSLERSPLVLAAWSIICLAVHIMLIGAFL